MNARDYLREVAIDLAKQSERHDVDVAYTLEDANVGQSFERNVSRLRIIWDQCKCIIEIPNQSDFNRTPHDVATDIVREFEANPQKWQPPDGARYSTMFVVVFE